MDDDLLIAGIVVVNYQPETPARRKQMRAAGREVVRKDELQRVIERTSDSTEMLEAQMRARMDAVVQEFRDSKTYQQEVIDALRPDVRRALAQVHDYKQFVQQIIQNMNVILEERHPGLSVDDKLERSSMQEKAIYHAAVIMDEKLDAMLFLESPERIREAKDHRTLRLHGSALKYVRIYDSRAKRKGINLGIHGRTWGSVYGNVRALSIIPHTLIDNATKYAPTGTEVRVCVREDQDELELVVEGYGPKIDAAENARIFDPFFRGRAARALSSEGMGYGLASAQNIARAHGTEITFDQGADRGPSGTYWTAFAVRFRKSDAQRHDVAA
ncbi:MAG: sensor histidine kinase [Acidimicrobiales bacterium]